jgi:hypothetical protein
METRSRAHARQQAAVDRQDVEEEVAPNGEPNMDDIVPDPDVTFREEEVDDEDDVFEMTREELDLEDDLLSHAGSETRRKPLVDRAAVGLGRVGAQGVSKPREGGGYYRRGMLGIPATKWIKPDKYSATTPVEAYLSHFETISEYNGWNEVDKVAHLKASLTGDAAQLLWDSGNHQALTYTELASKLRSRFGSFDHHERFACQLRVLKRQPSQSLQSLYNEVKRLIALAYPTAFGSELGEIIARDAFISALNDRELEMKVRDKDPLDLETAFRAAVRIESYLRTEGDGDRAGYRDRGDRRGDNRNRQVRSETAEPTPDREVASVLRELR